MFSKAVLYPGLLLFVHQSLSWTVKAIYYHHTLTRATILRFFPTPRSVSCTRDLLCCSKLDLGHFRRLCERDNDIINALSTCTGRVYSTYFTAIASNHVAVTWRAVCAASTRLCAFATAKWVFVYHTSILQSFASKLLSFVWRPVKATRWLVMADECFVTLLLRVALCTRQLQPLRMFRNLTMVIVRAFLCVLLRATAVDSFVGVRFPASTRTEIISGRTQLCCCTLCITILHFQQLSKCCLTSGLLWAIY